MVAGIYVHYSGPEKVSVVVGAGAEHVRVSIQLCGHLPWSRSIHAHHPERPLLGAIDAAKQKMLAIGQPYGLFIAVTVGASQPPGRLHTCGIGQLDATSKKEWSIWSGFMVGGRSSSGAAE